MRKTLFVIILVTIFNLAAFAQKAPQFFAVKTENGLAVVYNNGNKTFAFEIFGKEIKNVDVPNDGLFFLVDGKPLQIAFPKVKDILGNRKITDEKEILKAHQSWEIGFQAENIFKQKLTVEDETTVFLNLPEGESQQTFFWMFKRPAVAEKSDFNADSFQTTLIGDTVLVIGSPLVANQNIRERRQFFNGTLSTLVFFDKEINPMASKPKN